ncbi:GNAT family N-acetyltransferase [Bacillus suaedae]|uniref:GNAT family N-acetyltransferase n=1 Tax=Halalkalibacter suaedae TaxID=2822140 RepID=A0A940X078_9BACI|nr:GNAT family N-acetyltransferase [Bacillus suaedae]MBP3951669.1 GNAT family N-acetyltransferase [Bacillus suaedae]
MNTRTIVDEDYFTIIDVIDNWWGDRQMSHLLPRLFFEHFQQTSFIVEDSNHHLAAFLIGFLSQTQRNVAYIHFVGVNPEFRNKGLARELYNLFFLTVHTLGCETVKCITSPTNEGSVSFHRAMGFSVALGTNYAGYGQDRIIFSKYLG